jgi:hypothetical protein
MSRLFLHLKNILNISYVVILFLPLLFYLLLKHKEIKAEKIEGIVKQFKEDPYLFAKQLFMILW